MPSNNKKTIYLSLENLQSEHCSLIISKELSKIKEIVSHNVELNNNRVSITINNNSNVISTNSTSANNNNSNSNSNSSSSNGASANTSNTTNKNFSASANNNSITTHNGNNYTSANNSIIKKKSNNTDLIRNIISVIENLGYPVLIIKKTFPILNLSCASCAISSETIIKNSEGVLSSSVNFANSSIFIEYLPNMTNAASLQKTLQSIGFDLLIEEDTNQQETLHIIQQKKLQKLKKKTIVAILLSLPVFLISMFFMNISYANEIMFIFSTPVVFWIGRDFYINAWKQARRGSTNMDTLVALSTSIAYSFSIFNMFFPEFWIEKNIEPHVYFEAASVIISFILLGKFLEEKAKNNTSTAIKKLMGLQPKTVTLINSNNQEQQVPIEKLNVGDIILVKPGERIAVDGIVTSGQSYVDESTLTGESIPVLKITTQKVFAGTMNQKGSFCFKAEKIGKETLLAQIIKLVQEAQGSKAPVQKLVDKIASIFVPVVISIAILSFLLWIILGGTSSIAYGLLSAITVLVIACPCALGLATPTAIMVGVGKGAEKGILIKDAESLETSRKINTIVLDKTGTITEGHPKITNIKWLENLTHINTSNLNIFKNILVSIEKLSEHPLAEAITTYKDFNELPGVTISNFESISGKGVKAEYETKIYYIGNKKLLDENSIVINKNLIQNAENWSSQAQTVIFFADSKQALATISISDKIKKTSRKAIKQLQDMNIELYMLTGDNKTTASAIAQQIGIKNYESEMLPQQKSDFIKKLQQENKIVAMIGDGINDSAALATADISIAMGKGSDIAMDVAKMTIISSELTKIPTAIHLSEQTVFTIKQNLFWAFIYNIIAIPIAAGVLYPINGFLLNPMIAGAAMAMSSVSVVSNSLRLKYKK